MAATHLPMRTLDALLATEDDGDPFAAIFDTLQDVFGFDQALVLDHDQDIIRCAAAQPPALAALCWRPGPFFREVASGRVSATADDRQLEEWQDIAGDLITPTQPALYLPICVHGRRGLLILLRDAGRAAFDDGDLGLARQFALFALAARAIRNSKAVEEELTELDRLADELRHSANDAQRESDRLRGILELLPIGLTVQDENGEFVLVNEVAAVRLNATAEDCNNAAPAECPVDTHAALRPDPMSPTDEPPVEVEESAGERTWLTSRRPVQVLGETLVLSASLDITERKQIESDLERRAYSDDLTGLANRTMIQEHVENVLHAHRNGDRFALAFIDLDNFKHINDYYSHAIGDALLVRVAQRIADVVRGTDMLARISGDEFVLLVNPVDNADHIYAVIESLIEKLKQPFHIEGFEVFTSASIGVSIYPEHGASYEELRRNADSAMYRAKSGTKGAAAFFDLKMGQSVTARMELEQRLRLAIRDCQFCCAFQPKVDIRSQEVVGFETLVRWIDGDGEIQTPNDFIGLATELGLIDPITHFVLGEAIRSMALLDEAFGPGKSIAINVAAKQAGDPKFMRSFVETLQASRQSERFIVEVTEDAFIAKNQFQVQVLPMLRDIGVRVSIDDFGTGYSSLSVLADITADEIKIDRSFITDIHQRPRSQSILKAIESVSYALGMSVVAEGVETFEELAYLQGATRIRYAQGYHFAKPFFLEDVAKSGRDDGGERSAQSGRELSESRPSARARAIGGARSE
jgi:c-di-GMP phosphodiesterase Gmr